MLHARTYDLSKWRPIETAPRDGTRIIIYTAGNDTVVESYWKFDEQSGRHGWTNPFIGFGRSGMNATHWMPRIVPNG